MILFVHLILNNILSLQGNTMQATIRKHDVEHFKQILSEGNVYVIENFNVIPSRDKYQVVNRKYMIQISNWTNIVEIKDDAASIPFHIFSFISFDNIRNKRHDDGCLLGIAIHCLTLTFL